MSDFSKMTNFHSHGTKICPCGLAAPSNSALTCLGCHQVFEKKPVVPRGPDMRGKTTKKCTNPECNARAKCNRQLICHVCKARYVIKSPGAKSKKKRKATGQPKSKKKKARKTKKLEDMFSFDPSFDCEQSLEELAALPDGSKTSNIDIDELLGLYSNVEETKTDESTPTTSRASSLAEAPFLSRESSLEVLWETFQGAPFENDMFSELSSSTESILV
jgi:hypothetical protein